MSRRPFATSDTARNLQQQQWYLGNLNAIRVVRMDLFVLLLDNRREHKTDSIQSQFTNLH